jgi:hypothetical protein
MAIIMDENYTKRELDEHFKDLKESVHNIDMGLSELNKKVGLQNGRVGKLETKIGGWIIAVGCITFLFGIITALVIYSFQLSMENLKTSILLEVKQ